MTKKRKSNPKKKTSPSPDSSPGLKKEALRNVCDPKTLGFKTTDELPRLTEVIGQPRAFRALELGTEISSPGFNIFALGLPGSGKTTLIREYLERKAEDDPVPDDWCYVNNFANSHEPKLLRLPAGRAVELRSDVRNLIDRCKAEISRVFESEEYTLARGRLTEELEKTQNEELEHLTKAAAKNNFMLAQSPMGFMLVPMVDGKPLSPEELSKISPEQRAEFEKIETELQGEVKKSVVKVQEKRKETHSKVKELDKNTALFAVEHLIEALRDSYVGLEPVVEYFDTLKDDIVANAGQFRQPEKEPAGPLGQTASPSVSERYDVNVLVDNTECKGAPVIVENHPSYHNLLGRIEHEVVLGATKTNFNLIRAGALHRANGGYLILPAREVMLNTYAWEGLERALREGCIRIVEMGTQLGLLSTATLEPEPIPLDVKIVLIGTPALYYLLRAYDEDFAKLFKVKAEFATLMDRTKETENEYALFVKAVVDDNELASFDRSAVARIIEFGSRLAEDQNKLSTRFGQVADLIREAAHWAKVKGDKTVSVAAIDRAIEEAIYRNNLIEERLQELVDQGLLLIETKGEAIGQVNALSVLQIGDYAFGRPTRVTATVHPGRDGVVDIEREAKLGGRAHTKGVLIIGGFLGSRYGQKQPLNLSSRLTFEQSYEGVEGDSASAAELFALLSAIAGIPLRQDRAMTGSVNQYGQIQPIGGVNEKIEGFFASCDSQGLSGSQGVIIPESNVSHLMLKLEVLEAVEAGKFHIWPISTVDEGLSLLTGREAGELQDDGSYLEGTFNHAVMARLEGFAESLRAASADTEENEEKAEKE
jgi:lon-related putative ATP-dependent protease